MSNVTELIREAPAYKKAVLAVAVTAGVGACVYIGYRQFCGPQTSDKPRGPHKPRGPDRPREPSKSEVKPAPTPASPAKVREPSTEKEEHKLVKPEPVKIAPSSDTGKEEHKLLVKPEPVKIAPSDTDRSVLTGKKDAHKTASPLRSEELSSSITFEKISLGLGESDNFEHVTLPQINPVRSSPAHKKEEKGKAAEEQVLSSSSFIQLQSEPSLSNPQDTYENLSLSQADPSISFVSSAAEEGKKEGEKAAKQTKLQQPAQRQEEAGGSSSNDEELASAASVVSIKDENDIVVVETHEDDSEKSKEVSPRSGMAAVDINFDPSRVSPVFGQQTYQRVDVEPEELANFDPAKSHPASVGFKFDSNI